MQNTEQTTNLENLSSFEKTCKMIGEKYGSAARELLDRIKKRKENSDILQKVQCSPTKNSVVSTNTTISVTIDK